MTEKAKQYPAIDIVKFVCAIVILMYHYFSEHGPVFKLLEESLSLYAVAVALFMTLSGYLTFTKLLSLSDKSSGWSIVKKQVKRILTIYLLWSIPYLIFTVATWDWASGQVTIAFLVSKIQGWIFSSTFYTIWFMPALALGLVIAYWLYVKLPWKVACAIGVILYVCGALQSTYSFVFSGNFVWAAFSDFSSSWLQGCRGGIFFGVPLILLGGCAAKIKWRNPIVLSFSSVACMVLLLAEAIILRKFIGGCGLDLAFMMLPTCLSATMLFSSLSWKNGAVYKWMRSMSVLIFMSQRLFLTVIPYFLSKNILIHLFANTYIGAIVICGAVLLFSMALIALSTKWKWIKKLY